MQKIRGNANELTKLSQIGDLRRVDLWLGRPSAFGIGNYPDAKHQIWGKKKESMDSGNIREGQKANRAHRSTLSEPAHPLEIITK